MSNLCVERLNAPFNSVFILEAMGGKGSKKTTRMEYCIAGDDVEPTLNRIWVQHTTRGLNIPNVLWRHAPLTISLLGLLA